jgi:hypothetical protein
MSDKERIALSVSLMFISGVLLYFFIGASFDQLPSLQDGYVLWIILSIMIFFSILQLYKSGKTSIRNRALIFAGSFSLFIIFPAYHALREVEGTEELYSFIYNNVGSDRLFEHHHKKNDTLIFFADHFRECGNDPTIFLYNKRIDEIVAGKIKRAGYSHQVNQRPIFEYSLPGTPDQYSIRIVAEKNFILPDEAVIIEKYYTDGKTISNTYEVNL